MEIKVPTGDGQEKIFSTPGEAVAWGYKEVDRINKEISELINRKEEVIKTFGLKIKKNIKKRTDELSQNESQNGNSTVQSEQAINPQ